MAKHTIELREIENCICYLFPKNFPFYTDSEELRQNFIQKFYDEYMFREIGFETVERFKRCLLGRLNLIMPLYEQYYHTRLECKNISFMLNKDLVETFEREITGTSEDNSNATTNASGTSTANSNDMMYDTPNTRIDDMTKYPTQGSQGENTATTSSNATSTNNQTGENNQSEKTTLISKGNIGITSSAQLLKEWRDVIINIDEMILNDLEDLFLLLY